MQVVVTIPSALRSHTEGTTRITVDASTVAQALRGLEKCFPALVPLLRDGTGQLYSRVNIYVNDEHVRYRQGVQTSLRDGDTVLVMPIIMGG